MSKNFNIKRYNTDKQKSYQFCQQEKTMAASTDSQAKQSTKRISKIIDEITGNISSELIKKSENCNKLDVLDCCTMAIHKRTKPECKICEGNV